MFGYYEIPVKLVKVPKISEPSLLPYIVQILAQASTSPQQSAMMAEAPDPKTFGSWEDAFHFPIATVRGMERQLRSDIESNKERLRSLVGYAKSVFIPVVSGAFDLYTIAAC